MRMLLVEDDPRMRALVRRGLVEQGHVVDVAGSQPAALSSWPASRPYDVMVLDVMLPGPSGIDLVRSLRQAGNRTPVLMLTARDAAADIVAGLDAGADDYLTKPFAFKRAARAAARARPPSAARARRSCCASPTCGSTSPAHTVTRGETRRRAHAHRIQPARVPDATGRARRHARAADGPALGRRARRRRATRSTRS